MSTHVVAVTGATGLLGANLAKALRDAGHHVRATRRRSSSIEHLRDLDVEWVEADLGDPIALARAFRGCDVTFHVAGLVSARRHPSPELVASNVEGTRNVLAAVHQAQVPRLVHCSTVAAVGMSDDGTPCTEDSHWNLPERGMNDGYVQTKRQAEALVRAAVADGLDAVIVNPGYMFGPLDVRPSSGKMIVDIVRRAVPGWTPGKNNFADVRDVARGMLLAWEKGRRGERYILGGENMTYREVFERIATVAGVRPPRWQVPRHAAMALGWFGDARLRLTGRESMINTVSVRYVFCLDTVFSSAKAERELGYRAGSIDAAIRDAIAWFRARGMLR